MRACTIAPEYSMADVVATARGFAWSEETAPGLVLFRNGIATAGGSQFDFILETVYPSYADMAEKVSARLQRQAATDGRQGLDGVATCTDNVLIRNSRVVMPPPGGPGSIQPLTAMTSALCELNGATIDDAAAMARQIAQALGAAGRIRYGGYGGGQGVAINSRVRMDFFSSSYADFASSRDRLNQNGPPALDPNNPISCTVPSLSASYRIYPQGN